jgi:CDP-glucose 4,6-dehydratase
MESLVIDIAFWKNKRVLLTGHTGFKGSWLSLWLQQIQADVCGIALEPYTTPSLFELANVANNMRSHIVDVRNFEELRKVAKDFQPDIVIHMAAQPLVRYSYQHPIETYQTNVMGTVNVLEAVKNINSVGAVVNVTTDKCYDNKEWVWGYRENEAMGGHDPYSSSKGCSELVTSTYRDSFYRQLGKGLASARAGNVIGGGDWSLDRLITDIMNSITKGQKVLIRNPEAIRPWQHVLEPLSGYLVLAEKLYNAPNKYDSGWNFGPYVRDTATVKEIVEQIMALWGEDNPGWKIDNSQTHPHEAHFLKLDITKATSELGWQPKLSLNNTLAWVADWYKAWLNNENMQKFTLEQIKIYQSIREEK